MQKGVIPLELFRLLGKIAIQNSEANSEIDKTTDKAQKAEGKMSAAFKKIGTAVAAAFAVDKIADFGKACVTAAADVAAETAAFEQIMGEYADEAGEKVKQLATSAGIADTRLKPYMTSMTAKFKGLGYDIDKATDMAQDGLTIAADSAAFYDKSLEDAMGSLNSFINGNYEGGEAIGLFANETTLATWAAENLGYEWKTLSEAEKQFARMEFAKAMQEASNVTGQAAKESAAFSNVVGNLKERWRQFLATVGEPILTNVAIPAMQIAEKVIVSLQEKVQVAAQWFSDSGLAGALKEFANVAVPLIQAAYETIIKPAFDAIVSIITKILIPAFQKIVETITEMVQFAQEHFGFLQEVIDSCMKVIQEIINAFAAATEGDWSAFWNSIVRIVKNIGSALYNAGRGIFQNLWDGLKSIWTSIETWVSDKFRWITDKLNAVRNALASIKAAISEAAGAAAETRATRTTTTGGAVAAHAAGGILTKPTIFGYTPSTGTWHLGGEAGAEAIAPIDVLQGYVRSAVAAEMSGGIQTMIGLLEKLVDKDTKVYLNSKEISKAVNKDLGVVF